MSKTDRRTFLAKAGLLSLTAFSGAALLQACGGGASENTDSGNSSTSESSNAKAKPSTEAGACASENANLSDSDLEVRESVAYVSKSTEADKICKNCRFFQPDKFEGSCAGCMLFVNGGVEPGGYCKSWAAQEA